MFDRYGPNGLQVKAFIDALKELTPDEFARIGSIKIWGTLEDFSAALKKAGSLFPERAEAVKTAGEDAQEAIKNQSGEAQQKIAISIAMILVVADRLSTHENGILYTPFAYFLGSDIDIIPHRRLYDLYKSEDRHIETFCEVLSLIDGREVYVKDRPDIRGTAGQGLCDAIVMRGNEKLHLEHTALMSYKVPKAGRKPGEVRSQKEYERLGMFHKRPKVVNSLR